MVMIRPALAWRHAGVDRLVPLLDDMVGFDLSDLAKQLGVNTSRPGYLKLRAEDLEWVTASLRFGRGKNAEEGRNACLHVVLLGVPHGGSVRLAGVPPPVATASSSRSAKAGVCTTGSRGRSRRPWAPTPCVYLPDDRTIVFEEEESIRKLAGPGVPPLPAFLRGPDWERASRGLLAVAIGNQDGAFAKSL